jgi:septal ring factor EnvC (AmiA/AmiB activator)
MAGEQRNLEQAKKELAEQEAVRSGDEKNYQRVLDRLQPYKDRVSQHERNIQAIQKELGKLR